MENHLIYSDAEMVAHRLGELGVSEVALREAINQGHLQRVRLTSNHPRIFPGLEMWGWCVGALRDQLRSLGWSRLETGNYELTVNTTLGLAIAEASGDEATGNIVAQPSNRSRKGRNTVDAVEANRQTDLFAELLPETKEEAAGNDTWILLHHTDANRKEIRMELSRPDSIGGDGKINSWSERIILTSISFNDDLDEIVVPNGPDIDVAVLRKVI